MTTGTAAPTVGAETKKQDKAHVTVCVQTLELDKNSLPMLYEEVATVKVGEDKEAIRIGFALNASAFYMFRKGKPMLIIPVMKLLENWVETVTEFEEKNPAQQAGGGG